MRSRKSVVEMIGQPTICAVAWLVVLDARKERTQTPLSCLSSHWLEDGSAQEESSTSIPGKIRL